MTIIGDILSGMKTFISLLRGINVSGKNRISMPDIKRLYESMGLMDVVTYIQSGNVVFDTGEIDQTEITKLIEEGLTRTFGADIRVILRDKDNIKEILKNNPFLNQGKANPDQLYVTFMSNKPLESGLKGIKISFGVIRAVREGVPPPPVPRTPSTPRGVETADGGLKPPRLGAGEINNLGSWRSEKPPANSLNPSFPDSYPNSTFSNQSQPIQEDEFIIHGKEVYLFCPNGYGKTKFSNTFFENKLNISATTRNWKTVNALYELAERR
jgi:uncharacterized protein (DUF1697 family)